MNLGKMVSGSIDSHERTPRLPSHADTSSLLPRTKPSDGKMNEPEKPIVGNRALINVEGSTNVNIKVHQTFNGGPVSGSMIPTTKVEAVKSWPEVRGTHRRIELNPCKTLRVGEIHELVEEVKPHEDVDFVYPLGFQVEKFIKSADSFGQLYTTPSEDYKSGIDSKLIPNNQDSAGYVYNLMNLSGNKLVIGFRCTKTDQSFDFRR